MQEYRQIQSFKNDLKEELRNEVTPEFMQAFDAARNSWVQMQERIEGRNEVFLQDLKMIVSQQQQEIEKRLDSFDLRLTKVEHGIWPKWMLGTIFALIVLLFIFCSILIYSEIALTKRETKIENMLKDFIESNKINPNLTTNH